MSMGEVRGKVNVRLERVKGMSNAEVKYAKELCMEGTDQVVGEGVGEAVKAVCVLKELVIKEGLKLDV